MWPQEGTRSLVHLLYLVHQYCAFFVLLSHVENNWTVKVSTISKITAELCAYFCILQWPIMHVDNTSIVLATVQ